MDSFADRLKEIIGHESVNSFAKKCELSEAGIRGYLNGTLPKIDAANKISLANSVSLDWLISGTASKNVAIKDDGFAYIQLVNVTASAGHGALVLSEDNAGVIAFQREYLRSTWFVNPSELFCMPVNGESMEPTIKSGEFLLVSKGEQHVKPSDGIFVVRLEGNIMVKRLQPLPGNRMKISSDNNAYDPFTIELNDGVDFGILGKVLLVNGLRRV